MIAKLDEAKVENKEVKVSTNKVFLNPHSSRLLTNLKVRVEDVS